MTIFSINKIEIIQKKLEQLYSEDPLKGWEKHKTTIKIELIDKNSIITQLNLFNLINPRTPLQMVSEPSNLKSTEEIYYVRKFRVRKLDLDLKIKTLPIKLLN